MPKEPKIFALSVLSGKRSTELTEEMGTKMKVLIHEYDGMMPLASAIGVLETVKYELMLDHLDHA